LARHCGRYRCRLTESGARRGVFIASGRSRCVRVCAGGHREYQPAMRSGICRPVSGVSAGDAFGYLPAGVGGMCSRCVRAMLPTMRLGYVSHAFGLCVSHAFGLCSSPCRSRRARLCRSRHAPAGRVPATLSWAFLLDAVAHGLHLQMHFPLGRMASRRPLAAVLAAIGRMLLTSAIMKSQAQFRYTEYPDMFA
jgi:hypothetical protein